MEITFVSDEMIAAVHHRFMGKKGPTDVITFPYGEIIVSADTAAAEAARRGLPAEQELALYTVHGLLHLNGFDDRSRRDAARMRAMERQVLKACVRQPSDT